MHLSTHGAGPATPAALPRARTVQELREGVGSSVALPRLNQHRVSQQPWPQGRRGLSTEQSLPPTLFGFPYMALKVTPLMPCHASVTPERGRGPGGAFLLPPPSLPTASAALSGAAPAGARRVPTTVPSQGSGPCALPGSPQSGEARCKQPSPDSQAGGRDQGQRPIGRAGAGPRGWAGKDISPRPFPGRRYLQRQSAAPLYLAGRVPSSASRCALPARGPRYRNRRSSGRVCEEPTPRPAPGGGQRGWGTARQPPPPHTCPVSSAALGSGK